MPLVMSTSGNMKALAMETMSWVLLDHDMSSGGFQYWSNIGLELLLLWKGAWAGERSLSTSTDGLSLKMVLLNALNMDTCAHHLSLEPPDTCHAKHDARWCRLPSNVTEVRKAEHGDDLILLKWMPHFKMYMLSPSLQIMSLDMHLGCQYWYAGPWYLCCRCQGKIDLGERSDNLRALHK